MRRRAVRYLAAQLALFSAMLLAQLWLDVTLTALGYR